MITLNLIGVKQTFTFCIVCMCLCNVNKPTLLLETKSKRIETVNKTASFLNQN